MGTVSSVEAPSATMTSNRSRGNSWARRARNAGSIPFASFRTGTITLMDGILAAARRHGTDLQVSGLPSAFHTCFASHPIHDYATYSTADQTRLGRFLGALLECGVRPTSRGTWFESSAHTDDDVKSTLDAVESALRQVS